MKRLSNRRLKLLGVKLDPVTFENLVAESSVKQISISDLVRKLITDHQQQGNQTEDQQDEIRNMRGEVKKLRREIALTVEIVLVHAAKLPEDKAHEWVMKTFNVGK